MREYAKIRVSKSPYPCKWLIFFWYKTIYQKEPLRHSKCLLRIHQSSQKLRINTFRQLNLIKTLKLKVTGSISEKSIQRNPPNKQEIEMILSQNPERENYSSWRIK